MKAKKTNITPSRIFTDEEIDQLTTEMLQWFHENEGNIFLDDFLYIHKKLLKRDVEYLLSTSKKFAESVEDANSIELAKLKKYGSADRLNSSIVKSILTNKHDWL